MAPRSENPVTFGDGDVGWVYTVRQHKLSLSLIALAAVLALVATLLPRGEASAATNTPPAVLLPATAYFGARIEPRSGESQADAILRIESQIGRKLAIDHEYYLWDTSFPTSEQTWTVSQGRIPFLNWKAMRSNGSPVRWSQVASGSEDAAIIARAEAIKSFGYPLYLSFHHEPENDLDTWGTPAEYAAAWRHVVTVFRDRGVTNVAFVWTMMGWSFDPRSGRDATSYYPGDAYVDIVGSDGYNWYPGRAGDKWNAFQTVFNLTNQFSVAHNKPWIAVEYGAQEDPAVPGRKAQWIRDVLTTAKSWPSLIGLLYFDMTKLYPWDTDSSASSMSAYREISLDPYLHPAFTLSKTPTPAPSPSPSPTVAPSPSPSPSPTVAPSPSAAPSVTPSPTVAPSPSATPKPSPSPSPVQPPAPSPTSAPSPTPAPSPPPSPSPSPSPSPTPSILGTLANTLNAGVLGATLTGANSGASGPAFDSVVANGGAQLVYDDAHTRGVGLSARHTAGPRGNSYYEWNSSLGSPSVWYGRVYVYLTGLPSGDIRLVRAESASQLGLVIELSRRGTIRIRDAANRILATSIQPVLTGAWVRLEWKVNHATGQVEVRVFNSPNVTTPTETLVTATGQTIGSRADQVQIGRSGSQSFSVVFWTDDPALSTNGFVGPVA